MPQLKNYKQSSPVTTKPFSEGLSKLLLKSHI